MEIRYLVSCLYFFTQILSAHAFAPYAFLFVIYAPLDLSPLTGQYALDKYDACDHKTPCQTAKPLVSVHCRAPNKAFNKQVFFVQTIGITEFERTQHFYTGFCDRKFMQKLP
jgi:hypothetical protein